MDGGVMNSTVKKEKPSFEQLAMISLANLDGRLRDY